MLNDLVNKTQDLVKNNQEVVRNAQDSSYERGTPGVRMTQKLGKRTIGSGQTDSGIKRKE